jgi:hypothetical protein
MAENNTQKPGYFSPLGQRNWLESLVSRDTANTALNVMKPVAVAGDVAAFPISLGAQFLAGATGAREGVSATPFYDYARSAEEQQKPVVPGAMQRFGAQFGDFLKIPSNTVQAIGNFIDPQEVSPVQSWTPKTDVIRSLEPQRPALPPGNGIVPNADVSGMYMPPAQKPAGRPISVVRALQNTDYLPIMNDQGQVQYVSREVLADRASKQQAAAKADADIKKTMSETEKNLRYNKATETRMAPLPSLEATLNSPNSTEKEKAEARQEIANIWGDVFKIDLQYLDRFSK